MGYNFWLTLSCSGMWTSQWRHVWNLQQGSPSCEHRFDWSKLTPGKWGDSGLRWTTLLSSVWPSLSASLVHLLTRKKEYRNVGKSHWKITMIMKNIRCLQNWPFRWFCLYVMFVIKHILSYMKGAPWCVRAGLHMTKVGDPLWVCVYPCALLCIPVGVCRIHHIRAG